MGQPTLIWGTLTKHRVSRRFVQHSPLGCLGVLSVALCGGISRGIQNHVPSVQSQPLLPALLGERAQKLTWWALRPVFWFSEPNDSFVLSSLLSALAFQEGIPRSFVGPSRAASPSQVFLPSLCGSSQVGSCSAPQSKGCEGSTLRTSASPKTFPPSLMLTRFYTGGI